MKFGFTFYLLLTTYYLFSDMPGNKPRPDYNVKISGLTQYADYTFFSQAYDSLEKLNDSSLIYVQGGFGAPQCVSVWAVQRKTNKHTDTIYICSGEEDVDKAVLVNIYDNHLTFTVDTTFIRPEKNDMPFGAVNDVQNTQSVKNKNIMYFISGLSFLVLLALVFFVWKKNKKSKNQKP